MQEKVKQFTVTEIEKPAPKVGQIRAYAGDIISDGRLPCNRRMLRRHVHPKSF